MRIQLKQNEIEAALKSYLASQGIAVSNKAITMDFTAGRKNKGVSVEVVIEDAVLTGNNPGNVTVDEAQKAEAAYVVLDIPNSLLQAAQTDLGSAEQEQEDPIELEPEEQVAAQQKPSVGSLFGS